MFNLALFPRKTFSKMSAYSGRHKYSARNKYSVSAFFNKFLAPKKIFLPFFFFYPLDWSILYKKSKEKIEKYFS
jgi:hypothetical protein